MEKAPKDWPVSRIAALVVAVFFALAPIAIRLVLLPGDHPGWRFTGVVLVFLGGSLLLFLGTWRWYGAGARRQRLAGFALVVLAAVATVSFAFVLVPLALLAAFSLKRQEPARLTPAP
jgi:uncharacterized membrane protein YidH (DUF202 family)